jgi:crotonobetainyl-CoA:carnitine CoA-transferase CaiB-like acyl-CoA transferase
MFDFSITWHAPVVSHYLVGRQDSDWESWLLNGGSFYDFYRTADDRYLSVGSLEPKFWQGFCQAIGRPDLIEDGLKMDDLPRQQVVKVEIQKTMASRAFAEWVAIFAALDLCVEPVLTISEMINHPQTQARQMIVDLPKNNGDLQQQVGSPFKFSRSRPIYKHIGAELGQHTHEVLAELGYSKERIAELAIAGLFG